MFLDASALTAMLADEEDAHTLLTRMQAHADRRTSPLAVWEASIAVARILALDPEDAMAAVEEFLSLTGVTVDPVPPEAHRLAIRSITLTRMAAVGGAARIASQRGVGTRVRLEWGAR